MKRFIQKTWAIWFYLAVWTIAAHCMGQEIYLVSPARVLRTLAALLGQGAFWGAVLGSLGRILLGFLCAVAMGVALAVLTVRHRWARQLFAPLLGVIKATPVASFTLLALVWLKTGLVPAFMAFLMVLPILWSNVEQGIRQTDARLLEMARVYGFSVAKTIKLVIVPSVAPYFLSAFTTAMGMAWKAGVAAEVICQPAGSLGRMLYQAKIYLETPELLAWTVVVVALSVALEKGFVALLRRALPAVQEQKGGDAA